MFRGILAWRLPRRGVRLPVVWAAAVLLIPAMLAANHLRVVRAKRAADIAAAAAVLEAIRLERIGAGPRTPLYGLLALFDANEQRVESGSPDVKAAVGAWREDILDRLSSLCLGSDPLERSPTERLTACFWISENTRRASTTGMVAQLDALLPAVSLELKMKAGGDRAITEWRQAARLAQRFGAETGTEQGRVLAEWGSALDRSADGLLSLGRGGVSVGIDTLLSRWEDAWSLPRVSRWEGVGDTLLVLVESSDPWYYAVLAHPDWSRKAGAAGWRHIRFIDSSGSITLSPVASGVGKSGAESAP